MDRSISSAAAGLLSLLLIGCSTGGGMQQQAAFSADAGITFHNRVETIFQDNCQACHRPEGGAPFALVSYDDAYRYRTMIRDAVAARRMPPWHADLTVGHWMNDRSLTEGDLQDLIAWIDAGAPRGNPADAPPPRQWVQGWHIGEPDFVTAIPEAIQVPATEELPYQDVFVRTDFGEDRWIQAMEIRPTAPGVVHHVLVFIEPPVQPGERQQMANALEGFFAAYGPGYLGVEYPEGTAKLIPAGSTLRFQLHYEPNGRDEVDQTEIGFIFADSPPQRVVDTRAASNPRFLIPAGHPNYEVSAEYTFRESGDLLGFVPHMHIRGKSFRFELINEHGGEQALLYVPEFNFHWQTEYLLAEPITVTPGMRIRATGWFDNSPDNPNNPDPTKDVPFGLRTDEEMMIGYFHFLVDR